MGGGPLLTYLAQRNPCREAGLAGQDTLHHSRVSPFSLPTFLLNIDETGRLSAGLLGTIMEGQGVGGGERFLQSRSKPWGGSFDKANACPTLWHGVLWSCTCVSPFIIGHVALSVIWNCRVLCLDQVEPSGSLRSRNTKYRCFTFFTTRCKMIRLCSNV